MKKKFVSFMLLMSSVMSMTAAVNVSRIEPTDWFVGMKDASLQLMVYGKDIKNAEVTVNYPGVKIDSVARLESPNYLLVYLNLKDAKAGEMVLNFKQGKQSKKVKYQLKDREMAGEKRMGFTNEDVLYMLMPDRFANGNPKMMFSRRCATRIATVMLQVCVMVETWKESVSTWITSPSWVSRPFGLLPF